MNAKKLKRNPTKSGSGPRSRPTRKPVAEKNGAIPSAKTHVRKRSAAKILADWWWLMSEASADTLAPYRGRHIAVVNKSILGSEENSISLRAAIASQQHLDPESVVIYFVE